MTPISIGVFLELLDERREPPRDLDAARRDADEDDCAEVGIALDDFVRDAAQRTLDRLRIHDEDVADGELEALGVVMRFLRDLAGSR